MSDLAKPFDIPQKAGETVEIAMAAVKIYRGGAIGVIAGVGYARKVVPATPTAFIGVALETKDNSAGSAGDKRIKYATRGVFVFNSSGLTQADVLKTVYFIDDNTVTLTPGNVVAGTIITIDADGGVWVRIRPSGAEDVLSTTDFGTDVVKADTITASTAGGAITISGLSTGAVILGQATCVGVDLAADQPIRDSSGNELIKFTKTASAVNEITIENQATGVAPRIVASGSNTHVSLRLAPKGTAVVGSETAFTSKITVTTTTTAGAVTVTAAIMLGGLILRDPNGGDRTDTLSTAALLVAAMPGCKVGDSFEFVVRNTADAAETITIASGSGGTDSGTMTIAQNNSKRFKVVLTNVTSSSEAYTCYSLGTIVH